MLSGMHFRSMLTEREIKMGSVGTISKTTSIRTLLGSSQKLSTAVERAFNKANLIGENVDLYDVMYSYKAIEALNDNDFDAVYDYLAERLGFFR